MIPGGALVGFDDLFKYVRVPGTKWVYYFQVLFWRVVFRVGVENITIMTRMSAYRILRWMPRIPV